MRLVTQTLKQTFGRRRISDLTPEDAEIYEAKRSRLVKPATVNRELTVLKHMLTKAVEWNLLPDNPFRVFADSVFQTALSEYSGVKKEQSCWQPAFKYEHDSCVRS